MISFLRQIKSAGDAEYVLKRDGQVCCTAKAAFSLTEHNIDIFYQDQYQFRITPDFSDSVRKIVRNGKWRSAPCNIIDENGKYIGSVIKMREGTFVSKNYYTEIKMYGRILIMYEVGLGKEGMKYPVYEGDVQLAQIEKDPMVFDNLDEYTICSLDDFGELAALMAALHLDFFSYRNAGEHAHGKKSFQYVYTRRKEILAKYDPDFRFLCERR